MSTSNSDKLVTIFGASGFLGRYITRALAADGYRIRAAVRRPHLAEFLKPAGRVGQIQTFQANIRDEASSRAAIRGADIVINLVGILHQTHAQKFDAVQGEAPGRLARMAKDEGVSTFIQMSSIGADKDSSSKYARTKSQGEQGVHEAFPDAHIIRPSIVFGVEDDFFNKFGAMARISPALPLIGGGKTKFQPVYVDDIADVVCRILGQPDRKGAIWELGGPDIYSFKELMELLLKVIGRNNLLIPIPFGLAKFEAFFLGMLPKPLLTMDQVELLKADNIVGMTDEPIKTFTDLDITPATAESVLPTYLYRFRKHGQFSQDVMV